MGWRLLTRADVAQILGCSPRWISDRVRVGVLPDPVYLGQASPRWIPGEIAAFASQQGIQLPPDFKSEPQGYVTRSGLARALSVSRPTANALTLLKAFPGPRLSLGVRVWSLEQVVEALLETWRPLGRTAPAVLSEKRRSLPRPFRRSPPHRRSSGAATPCVRGQKRGQSTGAP